MEVRTREEEPEQVGRDVPHVAASLPSGEKGLAVSPKTMTPEPRVPLFVIIFSQVRLFPIINTFIGN